MKEDASKLETTKEKSIGNKVRELRIAYALSK